MSQVTKLLLGFVIVATIVYVVNKFVQESAGGSTPQGGEAAMSSADGNSLINGTFDSDADNWQLSDNWPVVWSSAEGNGSVEVTAVSDGGGTGRGVFSQCVDVSATQLFELGGRFKKANRSTQGGGGRIRVSWHEQPRCGGDAKTDMNSANSLDEFGWQQLRASNLEAPPGTQSVRVSVIQTVDGRGEFIAYWDDLYLQATQ